MVQVLQRKMLGINVAAVEDHPGGFRFRRAEFHQLGKMEAGPFRFGGPALDALQSRGLRERRQVFELIQREGVGVLAQAADLQRPIFRFNSSERFPVIDIELCELLETSQTN